MNKSKESSQKIPSKVSQNNLENIKIGRVTQVVSENSGKLCKFDEMGWERGNLPQVDICPVVEEEDCAVAVAVPDGVVQQREPVRVDHVHARSS